MLGDRVLVGCGRTPDSKALAAELAAWAPGAALACAQNDVDNEELFARHFDDVVGVVVRQTCARTAPNRVNALGQGRMVVGAHPGGESETARSVANAFGIAGFAVAVSERIAEDKWLKQHPRDQVVAWKEDRRNKNPRHKARANAY